MDNTTEAEQPYEFPNGFQSWMEVHHEVVAAIVSHRYVEDLKDAETDTLNDYALAERWTDEFEEKYKGHDWSIEGNFWDVIEAYMDEKIKGHYEQEQPIF